ncbi:protein Daple-like [Selaginella moellendorffii]|uniref:protein Daple-like n=1 Tax=Selaginella moellendorffii TaxID=88036 RepID=UPI000D1C6A12|nr:protein Daple-like [Selaginella moellendorffii]|eukprot:XP_024530782.1 protein Daple-like [Selaginella moellendorffii]
MDVASSNAALMRRIVQLESERDELRRDVEALCMQQSGERSGGDFMSRLQARRLAGLEQELEAYKNKVSAYKRENENLQEELSELYKIKSQVSELYKNESEKHKKLEQEIKFFQNNMASSISERDKLLLEIERIQNHGQSLEEDLKAFRRRQKEMLQENELKSARLEEMEENMEKLNAQLHVYHQVVHKFWRLRSSSEMAEDTDALEQAKSLVSDVDGSWSFGEVAELEKQLRHKVESLETTNVSLEKDLASVKAEADHLRDAKAKAESSVVDLEMRLLKFGVYLGSAMQELYMCHRRLKNDVSTMFKAEKTFLEATLTSFQEIADKIKTAETSCSTTGSRITSDTSDTGTSSEVQENKSAQPVVSQDAFLQALQDKVSALMLLSQEEERRHLECKTTGALEYQIEQLNETLSQVTLEKVDALMQVARLKYECDELKDRERDLLKRLEKPSSSNTGGRLLPASWAATTEPIDVVEEEITQEKKQPSTTSTSYLKSWLRGGGGGE